MDDQIGHVTNEISGEANVEEHVNHIKSLLPCVHRVEVSVPHSGECHY